MLLKQVLGLSLYDVENPSNLFSSRRWTIAIVLRYSGNLKQTLNRMSHYWGVGFVVSHKFKFLTRSFNYS